MDYSLISYSCILVYLKKPGFEKTQGKNRFIWKNPGFIGFFQNFGFFANPGTNCSSHVKIPGVNIIVSKYEITNWAPFWTPTGMNPEDLSSTTPDVDSITGTCLFRSNKINQSSNKIGQPSGDLRSKIELSSDSKTHNRKTSTRALN